MISLKDAKKKRVLLGKKLKEKGFKITYSSVGIISNASNSYKNERSYIIWIKPLDSSYIITRKDFNKIEKLILHYFPKAYDIYHHYGVLSQPSWRNSISATWKIK